jgi:hypothetical protein
LTTSSLATNPDCGFAASLAAVANVNGDWISSHVTYTGSMAEATSATITMYNYTTVEPVQYTIDYAAATVNDDDKTSVWYVISLPILPISTSPLGNKPN